jgi:hypothetical protein
MKFTPFILFLILIFVLILSIVFSRFFPLWRGTNQEGMIDYGSELKPLDFSEASSIPKYAESKQLLKVYDSIYYDTNNSNVIIVDGRVQGCTVTSGCTLATIEKITVIPPDGLTNYKIYNTNMDSGASPESTFTFSSKNGSWKYLTNDDSKINPDKYYIFYIAKDMERYMHIIKTPNIGVSPIVVDNICSFYHNKNGEIKEMVDYTKDASKSKIHISSSDLPSTSNDRTYMKLSTYDNSANVYQIKSNVLFDVRNGNLIIKESNTKIRIYDRSGKVITTKTNNTIPSVNSFTSWMVNDTIDKEPSNCGNIVLYMANAQKTTITILSLKSNAISMDNIYKFNLSGVDVGTSSSVSSRSSETNDVNNDINKWLAYWTVVAGNDTNYYSDDYLLKTQVVPPICPTCPTCPNNGTCTNCGGNGGSGTLSGAGTSVTVPSADASGSSPGPVNLTATVGKAGGFATTANPDTLGGATTIQTMGITKGVENIVETGAGAVGKTIDTASNIVQNTGSGAVGLLRDTGTGASSLITSGASGAVGLLRDSVGGAVGLAKDTVSGAVGLAKDAGSGVTNVLSGGSRYGQSSGSSSGQSSGSSSGQSSGSSSGQSSGSSSGQSSGSSSGQLSGSNIIDPYSYNGALVSKPSDFIPITANFSAFGK